MLSPPLGSSRLKAVETVAALVRVSDDTAERTLMGAGLIPRCLELFLRFPFNNLLHHQARCWHLIYKNFATPGGDNASREAGSHSDHRVVAQGWHYDRAANCRGLQITVR